MSTTSPPASVAALADQPSGSPPSQDESSVGASGLSPTAEGLSGAATPPDSEKHPKGKRKRTAAKDKMILEEAYCSNPKPDKQARQEIVQRVSLNEKEVQIWFQNRRQNDRRKSRPLTRQEIDALRFGGIHVISSDVLNKAPRAPEGPCLVADPTLPRPADALSGSPRHQLHATPSLPRSHSDIIHSTPFSLSQESLPHERPLVTPKAQQAPLQLSQESTESSQSAPNLPSNSIGYLANRWNLGSSFSTPPTFGRDDSLKLEPFPPSSCSSTASHATNQSQPRSRVRLSLSLEGKAELVSHFASPPRDSPPRPLSTTPSMPQIRQRSLQRSQSDVILPPLSALTSSLPPSAMRGRSRDVQAWESCADAERRDELMAQAEHESNGSAIAAINLLRSSSGSLQPSGAKRSAPMSKPLRPQPAKRARLGRTCSSVARLESVVPAKEMTTPVDGKVKVSMLVSPSGDSDKENWSPGQENEHDAHRRRPLPPAPPKSLNPRRPARVLQDQKHPSFLANRASTVPARHGLKEGIDIFQDAPKRPAASRDEEVELFMMRGQVSPSKKGDMDCVAGLLSLSKGAWR